MSPTANEVIEWLQKAEQDLIAARVLLEHVPPVLEPACFHCQQTYDNGFVNYQLFFRCTAERDWATK